MSGEKKSNWMTFLGIGCLVIIVGGSIGGYLLYLKIIAGMKEVAAVGIEQIVESGVTSMQLSEQEIKKLMVPVKNFTKKIRASEVSVENVANVGQALVKSPVFPALSSIMFENKYVKTSDIPEAHKQKSHVIVTRFVKGIIDEKIGRDEVANVSDILMEEVTKNGKKIKTMKQKLSNDDLYKCMRLMNTIANDAKIPDQAYEVDLAAELEKAISKGMAAK
ncbi:MAG: hypothetical protein HQM10_24430 [Candidatus Riflebacteria bacterium]|nr:hypothetical protein [Candidatus Riflebacteria bacterium]